MIIPEKIKIGAYEIIVRKQPIEETADRGGDFSSRGMHINITEYPIEVKTTETFLHEVFEAIKWIYQLELKHQDVCILSETILAVIRDNNLDFRGKGWKKKKKKN